jgi:phage terminase large subunit-like protein
LKLPETLNDYRVLEQRLEQLGDDDRAHLLRVLGKNDLYFLLRYILSTRSWKDPEEGENATTSFWEKQWLLDRCREVQFDGDGVLDIWSRYHGKSTIKTFGFSILSMIRNPNITIGIFSVTKSVADSFLSQIKYELENNELLKNLYPDRFFEHPMKQAPIWTVEKGFVIKRPLNLKDPSVRGYGLVDTSFTGARISHAIYDDAVNEQSVTTSDMVEKVNERWELSLNLGMPGSQRHYVGTFYAHGDSYHHMASRGVRLRLNPCYEIDHEKSEFDPKSGLPLSLVHKRDKPVLFSATHLLKEEKLMGPGTFGVQMLCDPNAGQTLGFKIDWLKKYQGSPERIRRTCNVIVLVDPAAAKKRESSRTSMWAVGLGRDGNYYVLDLVWDNLNLYERTQSLFTLVTRWQPIEVRYEKYSMQSDIEHIKYVQEQRNFRFPITEVGGHMAKDDRIERLIPLFASGKVYFPDNIWGTESDSGAMVDVLERWINEEYLVFPNAMAKDGLDALSRLTERDLPLPWPRPAQFGRPSDVWLDALRKPEQPTRNWMTE